MQLLRRVMMVEKKGVYKEKMTQKRSIYDVQVAILLSRLGEFPRGSEDS